MSKAWSGRFKEETLKDVELFTESISFDKVLALYDIEQDFAHLEALLKANVISKESYENIKKGLQKIKEEIEKNEFIYDISKEDIHMNIESRLYELIGEDAKKLHTGRSRNDQVNTDLRLYLKKHILDIFELLKALKQQLILKAKEYENLIIPGYTHLQRAQPVLVAHYLLSFKEAFLRDSQRLIDAYRRIDTLTLGSGALAGADFPLDRFLEASILNFSKISRNSMDAVADRDFAIEYMFCLSTIAMHLSRMAEDFIIFNTEEFKFIDLPDSLCTGSSIMPQKKNPDVLELIRGKTGRVYGDLINLMINLKGLPMTYNRDLQEDKEPIFDATKTITNSLKMMILIVKDMKFREYIDAGNLLLATDLANYLVEQHIPFREAHHIVGNIVAYSLEHQKPLESLTKEELNLFSKAFDKDAKYIISKESSILRKKTYGSTHKDFVKKQLELSSLEENIDKSL
ncbi:MAG: argininosuccinate lyase [Hydrogenobaculum sp.]